MRGLAGGAIGWALAAVGMAVGSFEFLVCGIVAAAVSIAGGVIEDEFVRHFQEKDGPPT